MGDPAGIGPEICLRALTAPPVLADCTPVIFGDDAILKRAAHAAGIKADYRAIPISELDGFFEVGEPLVVDCRAIDAVTITPGKISGACGRAAYEYIEHAIKAALAGKNRRRRRHRAGSQGIASFVRRQISRPHRNFYRAHRRKAQLHDALLGQNHGEHGHDAYRLSRSTQEKLSVERVLNVIELTAQAMKQILRRELVDQVFCGLKDFRTRANTGFSEIPKRKNVSSRP